MILRISKKMEIKKLKQQKNGTIYLSLPRGEFSEGDFVKIEKLILEAQNGNV